MRLDLCLTIICQLKPSYCTSTWALFFKANVLLYDDAAAADVDVIVSSLYSLLYSVNVAVFDVFAVPIL